MSGWTPEFEADLTILMKDWLKHQGRTQADLRRNLRAVSTRMPALLEVLEREYKLRGLAGLADRLCTVEAEWHGQPSSHNAGVAAAEHDPFGQLDLLLQEIRDDCTD